MVQDGIAREEDMEGHKLPPRWRIESTPEHKYKQIHKV